MDGVPAREGGCASVILQRWDGVEYVCDQLGKNKSSAGCPKAVRPISAYRESEAPLRPQKNSLVTFFSRVPSSKFDTDLPINAVRLLDA